MGSTMSKVFKELFYDEDNLEHTMYMQLCSVIEKKSLFYFPVMRNICLEMTE